MALNQQVHLYNVGTDYFYNKKEDRINIKLMKARRTKQYYKDKIINIDDLSKRKRDKLTEEDIEKINIDNKYYRDKCSEITPTIKYYKNKLNNLLDSHNVRNENRLKKKKRRINVDKLKTTDIVSSFSSTLTRSLNCEINELTEDIIFIQTFYFQVTESLIKYGFYWNDEEYIPYTASAGQIRQKKFVMIKKSKYEENQMKLTCGLTEDLINEKGGVNTNKYLAYLALNNSATDVWEDFDIDKSIVVDDFETMVNGNVDYIDYETYKIEKNKNMDIHIPHTDGIGIYLGEKNRMIRLPWVKGLMTPFDYIEFIKLHIDEYPNARYVNDIYGKQYDLLSEDIRYIFTKSQFKMYKYYESWEHYKDNYKKYNCHASYCNEERDVFPDAKIGYQMLQTLTDISDKEIDMLTHSTVKEINDIGDNVGTMMKILGAKKDRYNKTYYQDALLLYPEMLSDPYSRKTLKDIKKSLVEEGKGGKINISGKYTFICPDIYAFSEWLFLGIENPKGLLSDNQVSCSLYPNSKELDVLRSPSLFREHFIGNNIFNTKIRKWFKTKAIYMSSHCFASILLMYDVDGDQSLVCADEVLINVAKRNMDGINPLYYDMKKAPSQNLNSKSIYDGLEMAYKNTTIGVYSNNITKVWNSKEPNLDVVKLLCLESNFSIDSAKTLFFLKRPENEDNLISRYTKSKLPHFFIYAKDKKTSSVNDIDLSTTMGKIESRIPSGRLTFKNNKLGRFDYTLLMKNKAIELNDEIISLYKKLNRGVGYYNIKDGDRTHMPFVYQNVRNELFSLGYDESDVVDILVAYVYGSKTHHKNTLWTAFGDIILSNLRANIVKENMNTTICCNVCGDRIERKSNRTLYCEECAKKIKQENDKLIQKKKYYSRI